MAPVSPSVGKVVARDDGVDNIRVMSFNLRTETSFDIGKMSWAYRKKTVVDTIINQDPDVICTQEGTRSQIEDIVAATHDKYRWFGAPRGSTLFPNEMCAVLYKNDKLRLDEYGTFWLSDTPYLAGSIFKENGVLGVLSKYTTLPRIVTWGKFMMGGCQICVASTHWSLSEDMRLRSVDVMIEQLKSKIGDVPFILGGDFNDKRYSKVWTQLVQIRGCKDAWLTAGRRTGNRSPSYHGFLGINSGYKSGSGHIDWILCSNEFNCTRAGLVVHKGDCFPSDHYPVTADLTFYKT